MQILEFDDPRRPGHHGRCLLHRHRLDRRLGVICYEIGRSHGPTIAQAAEAVATSCLRLIPGHDPDELLWLQTWPPAAFRHGSEGRFPVLEVRYVWQRGEAHCPMWHAVEPALAETVRRLWYRHNGLAFARALANDSSA